MQTTTRDAGKGKGGRAGGFAPGRPQHFHPPVLQDLRTPGPRRAVGNSVNSS